MKFNPPKIIIIIIYHKKVPKTQRVMKIKSPFIDILSSGSKEESGIGV